VYAERVILCGGAINSPQLLQLSGVGEPDALRAAGVVPRVALPGVGVLCCVGWFVCWSAI
jgi:choline dehydrogenase